MMRTTIRYLIAVVALGAVSACTGRNPAARSTIALPFAGADLAVENECWNDVVVFAFHNGSKKRLGRVATMGTEEFAIPETFMPHGQVRLLLDPIGGGSPFLTDPILVSTGQRIELRIGHRVSQTSWFVR